MSKSLYPQNCFRGMFFPSREERFFEWLDAGNHYQSFIPVAAGIFSLLRPGIVLDVGANVGLLSRVFSQLFEEVYAFEPSAENRACIYRNLPEDSCNVVVFPYALGESEGKKTIYKCKINCGGDTLLRPGDFGVDGCQFSAKSSVVSIRTIDSLNIQQLISCIKIDVQGLEPSVLKGALGTLKRHKPVVICEIQGENIDNLNQINALLLSCGYQKASVLSHLDRLYIHKDNPLCSNKMLYREAFGYIKKFAKSSIRTSYSLEQIRGYVEDAVKNLNEHL